MSKRKFEKPESIFLSAQYENCKWTWLCYDEAEDHVFCIICKNANDHGMLNNVKVEDSQVKTGYCNWESARSADKWFLKHKSLKSHQAGDWWKSQKLRKEFPHLRKTT